MNAAIKDQVTPEISHGITLLSLAQLVKSPRNVRKTKPSKEYIQELATSIEAHGILQNLSVIAHQDSDGNPVPDTFEVIAGGCRLDALLLLRRQKKISNEYTVPCAIKNAEDATAISTAENTQRQAMHPADEFDAFKKMVDAGKSIEEVAAAFSVPPTVVKRRLKLANASPKMVAAYRKGDMTLDQLMALAITDDQALQERVWKETKNAGAHDRSPQNLRQLLTNQEIDALRDNRARLVGMAAYEAAGGTVRRDLFSDNPEAGYIADVDLLNRLAQEKLQAAADSLASEEWAWIETHVDLPIDALYEYPYARTTRGEPTPAQQQRLQEIQSRQDELSELLHDDENPPSEEQEAAYDQEWEQLEDEDATIRAIAAITNPAHLEYAGALVVLTQHGIVVHRHRIRPQDAKAAQKALNAADSTSSSRTSTTSSHSEKLTRQLTTHRTAALRAELGRRPDITLTAITYQMAAFVFLEGYDQHTSRLLDMHRETYEGLSAAEGHLESCSAWKVIEEQHQYWLSNYRDFLAKPHDEAADPQTLWHWINTLTQDAQLGLLAFCTAQRATLTVGNDHQQPRAELLATAVDLDMRNWWRVTCESYLDHIPKGEIVNHLHQAGLEESAEQARKEKKPEAAGIAQPLLADINWLPIPLRSRQENSNGH